MWSYINLIIKFVSTGKPVLDIWRFAYAEWQQHECYNPVVGFLLVISSAQWRLRIRSNSQHINLHPHMGILSFQCSLWSSHIDPKAITDGCFCMSVLFFFVRKGHLAHFPLFLSFFLLFLLFLKPKTEEDIILEAMEKWSRICRSTYRLRFCMWESENWGDGAVRNNLRWLDLYPCLFGLGIWLWVSYISTCSL